ncbi:DUF4440 domain-containing protein [Kytococcus sedentarius]|uniref:nuclear transport factor 2 family protein n=1 Tax=Kytococcus sedentarius TaxID=1276 RepID=UPI00384B180C
MTAQDLNDVLELEQELQRPSVRGDARRLAELFSPDFVEIGASGRRWDRAAILDLLAQESSDPDGAPIEMSYLEARTLAPDLIQVFWDSDQAGRRARHTSLWRRGGHGWQQVSHQGTLLP